MGGNRYEFNQTIAAFGTVEMPINSVVRSETVSDPFFHAIKLETTSPGGARIVPLVSFEQNVEVPQAFTSPLNSHFWGLKDRSRAHQILLVNPNPTAITIQSEAWDYGSSGTTLEHEIGDPITLQPFDAVAINATSSDPVIGREFDSHFNKVLHFFTVDPDGAGPLTARPFSVSLQEPDYGDVVVQPPSVSGRKFNASNNAGLAGWVINVYADANGNGTLEDADDGTVDGMFTVLATTTTATQAQADANPNDLLVNVGDYSFA